jgi:hypothetical protein
MYKTIEPMTGNIDNDHMKEAALMETLKSKNGTLKTFKSLKQQLQKECSCKIWKQ